MSEVVISFRISEEEAQLLDKKLRTQPGQKRGTMARKLLLEWVSAGEIQVAGEAILDAVAALKQAQEEMLLASAEAVRKGAEAAVEKALANLANHESGNEQRLRQMVGSVQQQLEGIQTSVSKGNQGIGLVLKRIQG